MAIFTGKADEGLPLLTQIQQGEDGRDFYAVLERFRPDDCVRIRTHFLSHRPIINVALLNSYAFKKAYLATFGETWINAARSMILSQKIIKSIYGKGSLSSEQVQWLQVSKTSLVNLKILGPLAQGNISLTDLVVTEEPAPRTFTDEIKEAILNVLQSINAGETKLRKCEECRSIFVVERADQIYCSKRCGDRVANRRKRIRDKENLQEV